MSSDCNMNLKQNWYKFFCSCGIPTSQSAKYANTFTLHRIDMSMLDSLNKELLKDLGVDVMGDIIAILRESKKYLIAASGVLTSSKNSPNVVSMTTYHSGTTQVQSPKPIRNTVNMLTTLKKTTKTNTSKFQQSSGSNGIMSRLSKPNSAINISSNRSQISAPKSRNICDNMVSLPSGLKFQSKFGSHNNEDMKTRPMTITNQPTNGDYNKNTFHNENSIFSRMSIIHPNQQYNLRIPNRLCERIDFGTLSNRVTYNAGKSSIMNRVIRRKSSIFHRLQ